VTPIDLIRHKGNFWVVVRHTVLAALVLVAFYALLIALSHVMAAPKDGSASQEDLAKAVGTGG
jgi:hypothetical protein